MASIVPHAADHRFARRREAVVLTGLAIIALVFAVASGSQGNSGSNAPPTVGDVATTVVAFGNALENGDYKAVCSLFTAQAQLAEGGADCAQTLSGNGALLSSPKVKLKSVSLRGSAATATINVTQKAQPPMSELLQLTRVGGRFLIAGVQSLGD